MLVDFKTATEVCSGDMYVTVSSAMPWYNALLENCEEFKKKYTGLQEKITALKSEDDDLKSKSDPTTKKRRREILKELTELPSEETLTDLSRAVTSCFKKLDKYYQVQSDLVYAATALNPTLNVAYFKPVGDLESQSSIEDVKKEVIDVYLERYAPTEDQATSQESQATNASVSRIYRNLANVEREIKPRDYELQMYFEMPCMEPASDVLKWWNLQKHSMPNLASMAGDFLSIPATSTPSERAFSMAKHLLPPTRNRMRAETIEACMMLKMGLIKRK